MKPLSFPCASCHNPLSVSGPLTVLVACKTCRRIYQVTGQTATPVAVTPELPSVSLLTVGIQGRYKGKQITILGRLQIESPRTVWHHWHVTLDNERYWIKDAQNEMVIFRPLRATSPLPAFEGARVGQTFDADDSYVLITNKDNATVGGMEGEHATHALPGTPIQYLEGTGGASSYFVEYIGNTATLSSGQPFLLSELSPE